MDRLNDLCVSEGLLEEEADDESDDPYAFVRALNGLTESLAAQLAFVSADTISPTALVSPFEQAWATVELYKALRDLKEKIRNLSAAQPLASPEAIVFLLSRMKMGLKKLDQ